MPVGPLRDIFRLQLRQRLLTLAVAGAGQAGPFFFAFLDGGRKLAVHRQAQAAALADQLDTGPVLAGRAEIWQAQLRLYTIPGAPDHLIGTCGAGIVIDARYPDLHTRMVGKVVKQTAAHDGAVSVWPGGPFAHADRAHEGIQVAALLLL